MGLDWSIQNTTPALRRESAGLQEPRNTLVESLELIVVSHL